VATKKLTKRQLKEDPVMKTAFEWLDFTEKHMRIVLIAAAVIVVAGALAYIVRHGRASAERSAASQLAQARGELQQGNIESALTIADQILDRAAGTQAGREALLLRADGALLLGRNEEAVTYFERLLRDADDPILKGSAMRGLAGALEQSGQPMKAAERYVEAGHKYAMGGEAAYDLMAGARAYRMAGDPAKAVVLYDEIQQKYPKFPKLQEIKIARAELGGAQAQSTVK
jgi:tetratricopeptide (TPR) repeat protein